LSNVSVVMGGGIRPKIETPSDRLNPPMFRWFSPFALPQQVIEQLSASGGRIWSPEDEAPDAETAAPLLVIYPPPHAALGPPAVLLAGYQKVHALKAEGHLLHLERLLAHPVETWNSLLSSEPLSLPPSFSLEQPAPFQALITLALLRERPALLDAYLDLELSSDLGGSPPDSEYVRRLRESSSVAALLDALHDEAEQHESRQQQEQLAAQQEKGFLAELESRARQLEEANNRLSVETERTCQAQQALEASDLVVLDLKRQLQELDQARVAQQQELADLHSELEQLFYSERQNIESLDRLGQEAQVLRKGLGESVDQLRESRIRLEENQQSLLDKELELERLRVLQANTEFQGKREQKLMVERQVDLEEELGTLRGRLQRDSANLDQAREDNQHLLGALHETEEELEHYFLRTQHGSQLMDAQQVQLQRAAALLQRMAALKGITVGIPISPPIQVMALLEGYRHSLKRAERLLGREVFSGEASRISE